MTEEQAKELNRHLSKITFQLNNINMGIHSHWDRKPQKLVPSGRVITNDLKNEIIEELQKNQLKEMQKQSKFLFWAIVVGASAQIISAIISAFGS